MGGLPGQLMFESLASVMGVIMLTVLVGASLCILVLEGENIEF
jgi:hypothetical protein